MAMKYNTNDANKAVETVVATQTLTSVGDAINNENTINKITITVY
jgi:hypothetical protein